MVPFKPVPIIEIPELGNFCAVYACDKFKVASQNDKHGLEQAKELAYLKAFYEGVSIYRSVGVCQMGRYFHPTIPFLLPIYTGYDCRGLQRGQSAGCQETDPDEDGREQRGVPLSGARENCHIPVWR